MKSKINQLATGLCAGALGVSSWTRRIVPAASDMSAAAKTGVVGTMLLAQSLAVAESNGLLTGITNATTGVKALIGLIAVVGVLAGLGFMFAAASAMYKKHNNSRDDITWGDITMKAVAGAVCMALVYFGTQFVVALGGSASDIGKTLGS